MKKLAVIISPNWRDYAEKYLAACYGSLQRQTRPADKIFLIDNESSEKSFNYLKKNAPGAAIIRNQHNAGFAEGNNVAMKQALAEGYDFIVLLNMDTVSADTALEELEKTAESHPEAGAIQARLMLWQDKQRINSTGNNTHFLGFGFCDGYNEKYAEKGNQKNNQEIFYPSGAAALFRAETLNAIGLFDEVFWMYAEDQDLGWRIWLNNQKCILANNAVVYHNYEFSRSVKKYFWMNRNRFLVILKNYHWLTLLLIAPAFVLMELGQILFSWRGGWLRLQLKVYLYLLKPSTWKYLARERKKIQQKRTKRDRDLKNLFSSRIEYQEISSLPLKIANFVFHLYWRIIKPLIIW